MSVAGGCHVCAAGTVESRCDRCGNLVCRNHYEEQLGVCVECAGAGGGRQF